MTNENKSFYSNDRWIRPQLGSETGVRGKENTRQVLLNEVRNYRRITHKGFNFYLAIIDLKHPKFVRRTDRGYERWRMRFNVFASGFFSEWMPNTEENSFPTLLRTSGLLRSDAFQTEALVFGLYFLLRRSRNLIPNYVRSIETDGRVIQRFVGRKGSSDEIPLVFANRSNGIRWSGPVFG